ncbi:fructosamine kinase family protein [Neiella marina]|uniref:Fructosamine kinase family protein n=1 Tax=Neiella holothuriorum TaxID=2870530 RepID=A0ABS7ECC6_9GAMM|nr:fructosamine kinase family protein [Neiella holothuriorum]MBW8189970.1 fructosamine kinase family protein [Neiella holothuriorum]
MQWHADEHAQIEQALKAQLGTRFAISQAEPVSGGDINQAYRLHTTAGAMFIKLNRAERAAMFEQEATGLAAIAATQTIRTPQVIATGVTEHHGFLALSWHQPQPAEARDWQQLAEQLAALHLADAATDNAKPFGFIRDNFIGTTPQPNNQHSYWPEFFAEQRIGHQLSLLGDQLPLPTHDVCQKIARILARNTVKPALLHGDLWAGNILFDSAGPLLIDPACYVGDGEADIAMTWLFGGYPTGFYDAYRAHITKPDDFEIRHQIYNLYHLLNHATLFGSHYLAQAEATIDNIMRHR